MLTGDGLAGNDQAVAVILDDLERNDRVGAVRHGPSRGDARSRAGWNRAGGRSTRGDAKSDRQLTRYVGRAHGEAVHRRAGERGEVDDGPSGLSENPSEGVLERDGFDGKEVGVLEDPRERLLDRQQFWHGPFPPESIPRGSGVVVVCVSVSVVSVVSVSWVAFGS